MHAHPVRTEGGAPTTKPNPTPTRRSTRPGCECVPTPFAPRAVLLQQSQTQPRPVGVPAPGANTCPPLSHRGRCSYNKANPNSDPQEHPTRLRPRARPFRTEGGAPTTKPNPTPTRRSTRPGCECVPTPFAPRRCSYGVLYNHTASQCG